MFDVGFVICFVCFWGLDFDVLWVFDEDSNWRVLVLEGASSLFIGYIFQVVVSCDEYITVYVFVDCSPINVSFSALKANLRS